MRSAICTELCCSTLVEMGQCYRGLLWRVSIYLRYDAPSRFTFFGVIRIQRSRVLCGLFELATTEDLEPLLELLLYEARVCGPDSLSALLIVNEEALRCGWCRTRGDLGSRRDLIILVLYFR